MKAASISDVAERAGVSASTVSRVMNGTAVVAPSTRERVEAAIRDLGYRPSEIARQLARRRPTTVGLIIPSLRDPIFTIMADGVEEAARAHGLSVILCNTDSRASEEDAHIDLLLRMRAVGIVVATGEFGTGEGHDEHYRALVGEVPIVFVGTNAGELPVGTVSVDEVGAGRIAAEHLISLGHRRIGFVGGEPGSVVTKRKLSGFEEALRRAGLEPYPDLYRLRGFGHEDARAAFGDLLGAAGRPPTGVVCASDVAAMGVVRAAAEHGLEVPRDLSVVGFDDIPFAAYYCPALTTVAQPLKQMGLMAVEELRAVLRDGAGPRPSVRLVEPGLVVRESTAPPLRGA